MAVSRAIGEARNVGNMTMIKFITGWGRRSPDGRSVLKKNVPQFCKEHGLHSYVDPRNRGVVVCPIH